MWVPWVLITEKAVESCFEDVFYLLESSKADTSLGRH